MSGIGDIRRNMDLDIARPNADQFGSVSIMRYPGGRDFLTAICTFPGELCTLETIGASFSPRSWQALITVIEQVAGNMRGSINKDGQHENFGIPEGMPAIAEAGEGLRTDIDAVVPSRSCDEELEQAEADSDLGFVIAFDLDITALPFLTPGLLMRF